MNSLYDIFAGFNIFDCLSFQRDEESEHGKLRAEADGAAIGKDNYVLSTGHVQEPMEDALTAEDAGLYRASLSLLTTFYIRKYVDLKELKDGYGQMDSVYPVSLMRTRIKWPCWPRCGPRSTRDRRRCGSTTMPGRSARTWI